METSNHAISLKRVLVADDHPLIFIALAEMLETAFGEGVIDFDAVADGDSLLQRLIAADLDCLVLDLYMPGRLRSIPLLQAVRTARPELRTIVYTGAVNPCLMQAALAEGVNGYVSKASGAEVVIEALRMVATGDQFVDPAIDLDEARNHSWNRLTPGERAVLVELARGSHLQAIAIDSGRSYKTVTAHKYNALRKLGLRSKGDVSQYLVRAGLDYLLD